MLMGAENRRQKAKALVFGFKLSAQNSFTFNCGCAILLTKTNG
jgi:hypothetical protein